MNCNNCLYLHSCNLLNSHIDGWNSSAYPNRMRKELPLKCGNFKEKSDSECYSDIDPLTLMEKESENAG